MIFIYCGTGVLTPGGSITEVHTPRPFWFYFGYFAAVGLELLTILLQP